MEFRGVRLLLLAFFVLCAPESAAVGAHSLHYSLTVRCQGGSVLSRFFAQGHLDDQPFLSYDSERGSVEPCALWAETVLGPETWDTETQDLAENGKNLRVTLADINFLKEEKGGSHSLQESWGCEIREDNRTRGFWNFYYDGEPFLSYHPETRSWTVQPSPAQILAMKVKNSLDADGIQSKAQWAHVQGTVCGRLRRYLNSWIAFNETTVSPKVNITCDEVLEDTIIMTCWALGFYPKNIFLTWLQDGKPLSQDTQKSGSILSYGNGTYQTWVSTRIPQGQEQRFSCHVGHSGNHINGTVSCSEPEGPIRGSQQGTALLLRSRWPTILAAVVGAVIILFWLLWCKKRRTTSAAQGPDTPAIMKKPRKRPMRPGVGEPSLHSLGEACVEQVWGSSVQLVIVCPLSSSSSPSSGAFP
ncbi:MHC class I polypeptide-related sequence B-like [Ictidomys tridecemlineatus]|nr:MHC class I polypeptide-related sequence B-like [Ictidomys tridecemlineatus]